MAHEFGFSHSVLHPPSLFGSHSASRLNPSISHTFLLRLVSFFRSFYKIFFPFVKIFLVNFLSPECQRQASVRKYEKRKIFICFCAETGWRGDVFIMRYELEIRSPSFNPFALRFPSFTCLPHRETS